MQTLAIFVITSRLAISLCLTGSLSSAATLAVSAQSINRQISYEKNASISRNQPQLAKLSANPVLARNGSGRAEVTATSTTTRVSPPSGKKAKHDAKAVGRCWNRLMDMIREARQAHRREE